MYSGVFLHCNLFFQYTEYSALRNQSGSLANESGRRILGEISGVYFKLTNLLVTQTLHMKVEFWKDLFILMVNYNSKPLLIVIQV